MSSSRTMRVDERLELEVDVGVEHVRAAMAWARIAGHVDRRPTPGVEMPIRSSISTVSSTVTG